MIDLKAHGLRVKPLEWTFHQFSDSWVSSDADDDYQYWQGSDGNWYTGHEHAAHMFTGDTPSHPTADAAKAACQAHHKSQVLALLEQVEGGQ